MQRNKLIYWSKCAVALSVIPIAIYASATGPIPRHTGAPGDQTCAKAGCHVAPAGSPQVNSSNGAVQITYSGGTTYTPGERGTFTVTITDTTGRSRWGFQASARLASDPAKAQAGTLIAGAGTFVQCEDGKEQLPCSAGAPVQFVQHSIASTKNTFTFDWTAPAAGAGDVQVYVAGNAANGNGTESGDRIYTSSIRLTPGGTTSGGPKPAVNSGGAVNAWSTSTSVATNTFVSIYGTNLATTNPRKWDGAPEFAQGKLPVALDGVSVTIGGKPAPVIYISPSQLNVLVPEDTNTGNMPLVVTTANGESAPITVVRSNLSPALNTNGLNGKLYVTGVLHGTSLNLGLPTAAGVRPFQPGDVVEFYATGLGPTSPATSTSNLITTPLQMVNPVKIFIGQTEVPLLGPGYLILAGLYQVNGTIPDIPNGEYPAFIEVGGVRSPTGVVILIQR